MSEPTGPTTPPQGTPPGGTPQGGQPTQPVQPAPPGQSTTYPAPAPGQGPGGPSPAVPGPGAARAGLWRQATSTTGGLVAVIAAAGLCLLLVLGIVGVGAVAAVRAWTGHDRGTRVEQVGPGQRGPDRQGPGRMPMGGGARGPGGGPGAGPLDGGRLGGALGTVQHGEVTVRDGSGATVVMTLQRGTVTAAGATSLSVRSADGFTATYTVDSTTRGAGKPAKGDTVMVVAKKSGGKAVVVRVLRKA